MIRRRALPAATAGLIAGILIGRAAAVCWPAWLGLALACAAFVLLRERARFAALCCAAVCLGAMATKATTVINNTLICRLIVLPPYAILSIPLFLIKYGNDGRPTVSTLLSVIRRFS